MTTRCRVHSLTRLSLARLTGPNEPTRPTLTELREFRSHAKSLNVKRLEDDELEFYEKHCLLLPAVVRHRRPPTSSL